MNSIKLNSRSDCFLIKTPLLDDDHDDDLHAAQLPLNLSEITPLRPLLSKEVILVNRNSTSGINVSIHVDLLQLSYAPPQSRNTDCTTSVNHFCSLLLQTQDY